MKRYHLLSLLLIAFLVLILVACSSTTLTETTTKTKSSLFTETQTYYQTQTRTVTHIVTETPISQEILYSDSFDQAPSNWTTFSDSNGHAILKDGALYIMNFTDSDNASDSYPGKTYSDFILEVEMTFVGGTDFNWQSVICRYSNSAYYTFNISADGYYAIYLVDFTDIYTLTEPAYSNHIRQGYDTNIVRIECIGDDLSLIVNDELLVHITDSTYSSGEIGLAVYSMDGIYSEVSFDNLVMYKP